MWKRLQGHVREKERHGPIGKPVLLETTYDQDQLRRCPDIDGAHVASLQHHYRASEVPTMSESSVYSRPSHDLSYYFENNTATSPYADISPPSSPEPERRPSSTADQSRRVRSMRDVSPMDDHRKHLAPDSRPVSNIPVLRRAPPPTLQTGGDVPAAPKHKFWEGKLAPNSKVKWDDYSGEPSSAGRAASVSPASYAQTAPFDLLPMGHTVTVSGPEKKNASLAERMIRFGSKPAPVEPWSRATGRSEIAPVLQDDPTARSLPLPRPRRSVSPAVQRTDLELHIDPPKPIVPLKVASKPSHGAALTTPSSQQGLGIHPVSYPSSLTSQTQRSNSPDTVLSVSREAALPPAQGGTATPPYTTSESMNKTPTQSQEAGRDMSVSRFSWTTYNSATIYQHSPPPSPPPPLPFSTPMQKRRVVTEPTSAAPSILNRRRPVPQADRYLEPNPSARNLTPATPGTATIHSPSALSPSPSPSSPSDHPPTSNPAKALPQTPTTLGAADHLALLESQLEDLRIRRSNVYRLLTDLVNAAPANPLLTDFKRARVVEQQKRAFQDELAEIKREEHDVGMRVHRAWKKRERENGATGSALWVRRVTS